MNEILKVEKLVKAYGKTPILKGISFDVHEGEIFGLLGANGAGKSTTLECIEGIKSYKSGNIEVLGHKIGHYKDLHKVLDNLANKGNHLSVSTPGTNVVFPLTKNIGIRKYLDVAFIEVVHAKIEQLNLQTTQNK